MAFSGKRYTRAEREEILQRFEKSDASLQKFCSEANSPNQNSLRTWLKERRVSKNKFAQVQVQKPVAAGTAVTLKVGDAILEFNSESVPSLWLANVLKALQ